MNHVRFSMSTLKHLMDSGIMLLGQMPTLNPVLEAIPVLESSGDVKS